jgi:hypothetical protein
MCKTVSQIISGEVRCPPSPQAVAEIDSPTVDFGKSAVLKATKSSSSYTQGTIASYAWTVLEAPVRSPFLVQIATQAVLSNDVVYTTPVLNIVGSYKFLLTVSDGCTSSIAVVCFQVLCSCGPAANAGATPTVWTNAESVAYGVANADNVAGIQLIAGGLSWKLDGSLSYDFDPKAVMAYQWDFVSWASLDPTANTWTKLMVSGSRGASNLKVTCVDSVVNGDKRQDCSFEKITRSAQPQSVALDPPTGNAGQTVTRPGTVIQDASRLTPAYLAIEDFAFPTSQCEAEVQRTNKTDYLVTPYSQTVTTSPAVAEVTSQVCAIRIIQAAKPGSNGTAASLPQNNPIAYLSLTSLNGCRGLWTFSLTVTDACGPTTASTDEVKINVRCNEPPVAIAACNNTQLWTGTAFEQVRIDGRSSSDKDNAKGTLTYTWTFVQNEVPAGFCPQPHRLCVEGFCTDTRGFTACPADGVGFGPSPGVVQAERTCAPTVYPVIYNKASPNQEPCQAPCTQSGTAQVCTYPTIYPTQYFNYGQAAYFTPTKEGKYHIQLRVDDGCSSDVADVYVIAVCPAATVLVDYDRASSATATFTTGGSVSATLTGTVTYEANVTALTYAWSGVAVPAGARFTLSTATSLSTQVQALSAGTYSFKLTVSDGCKSTDSAPIVWRVLCNAPPAIGTLSVDGGASTFYYTGIRWPSIALTAAATDTDALTYSWTINGDSVLAGGLLSAALSGTGNSQLSFTPANSGPTALKTYVVSVSASDGCSSSTAARVTINLLCNQTLIGTTSGDTSAIYDQTALAFPAQTVDASGSSFPYGANGQKNYQWSVQFQGSAVTQGIQGVGTSALSVTPSTVGTYMVTLIVSDGCSSALSIANVVAKCTVTAVARLDRSAVTLTWNSFLGVSGGFAAVTLDGSGSTGYASPSKLDYVWSGASVASLTSLNNATSLNAAAVSYQAVAAGSTTFTLTVSNGPCDKSVPASVTVTTVCLALQALLRAGGSVPTTQLQNAVSWDGTKFKMACIDARGTTYTDAAGVSGNRRTLKYTFLLTTVPDGSVFGAKATGVELTDPALNLAYGTDGSGYVTQIVNTTVTRRSWEIQQRKSTVTGRTLLASQHYEGSVTCFKPDKAGTYSITLQVSDGCSSSTAAASVKASCSPPASINFNANGGVQDQTSISASIWGSQAYSSSGSERGGSAYTRVILNAQVLASATETYTYQWVLINMPASSKLVNNSFVSVNNNQGIPASFVPDFEGTYVFQLTAYDGCNPPVSRQLTVSTACTSNLALLPLQVVPRYLDLVGSSLPTGTKFTLSAGVAGKCTYRSMKWSFASRSCATYYIPSSRPPPAPAPVNSNCSKIFKCKWGVEDEPCTDGVANPLYLNRTSYTETVSGTFNNVPYSQDVRLPGFPEINRNPSGNDECTATFKCRHPGVYKMRLTISDECTTTAEIVTITCRCANDVKAVARVASRGAATDQTVYYQCQGNNNYDFQTLSLSGSRVSTPVQYNLRSNDPGSLYATNNVSSDVPGVVQKCPPTPVVDVDCSLYQKCCPAKECCPPTCPSCPACPACPACPSSKTGSADLPDVFGAAAGDAPVPAAHVTVARSAFAQSKRSAQQSEAQAFGIVAPLSALLVVSVIGNLVLPSVAKKLRAAEEGASAV